MLKFPSLLGVSCSSHNVTLHYVTFDNITLHVIALPCTEIVELYQTLPGALYGEGEEEKVLGSSTFPFKFSFGQKICSK